MRHVTPVLVISFVLAGCGADQKTPTAPTPADAPASSPTYTVSGVVVESAVTNPRPVAGARIQGWISVPGMSYGLFRLPTTDAQGRYQISSVPEGILHVNAFKDGYVQPCLAGVRVDRDAELEVELAPISAPRPTKVEPSTLSGTVFEAISGRRQPIEGSRSGRAVAGFPDRRNR